MLVSCGSFNKEGRKKKRKEEVNKNQMVQVTAVAHLYTDTPAVSPLKTRFLVYTKSLFFISWLIRSTQS